MPCLITARAGFTTAPINYIFASKAAEFWSIRFRLISRGLLPVVANSTSSFSNCLDRKFAGIKRIRRYELGPLHIDFSPNIETLSCFYSRHVYSSLQSSVTITCFFYLVGQKTGIFGIISIELDQEWISRLDFVIAYKYKNAVYYKFVIWNLTKTENCRYYMFEKKTLYYICINSF